MKQRAVDDCLSEETRESAQQALNELVSAQIERDKRAAQGAEAQFGVSEAMLEWLAGHRLLHFSGTVTEVAGL